MRTTLLAPVIVAAFCWASPAEAYDLIEVRSGDVILVRHEGEILALKVAGVWVPPPSGVGVPVEYMGDEARQFVQELVFSEAVYVEELTPRNPQTHVVVARIRVGEEGERDLSVILAESGLALTERSSAADEEQAQAIYQAEKAARKAQRGMHDGGLMDFRWSQKQEWDLGTQMVATSLLRTRGGEMSYSTLPPASSQPKSSDTSGRTLHGSAINAIRDWGSRMGLPRDSSHWGQ